MPSRMGTARMRSLFRRKAASPGVDAAKSLPPGTPDGSRDPATPAITPLDADGDSSASRSTEHEIYPADRDASPVPPAPPPPPPRTRSTVPPGPPLPAITSREGVPVVTAAGADRFAPSAVAPTGNYATEGFYSRSKRTWGGRERPAARPSAKASAFGGAPRYDWMDIETTAAIKIQAAYRRARTQDALDARGLSTPGMRNRRARLRTRARTARAASADAPFLLSLCGVGLLFGDGTLEDAAVVRGLERRRAGEARGRAAREDAERRRWRARRKEGGRLEEGIEVVESFEGEEEEEGGGGDMVGDEEGDKDGLASQEEARGRPSMRERLSRSMSRSVRSPERTSPER